MRTVTKRSKPRWRRRKNARPEEIITAALEAVADRGFAATKVEDVARKAGVTKGTIYLYFENKDALFKALIRETIVPVLAQGEARAQSFTLRDRKSTRLNSSHDQISYAVFCLKKKTQFVMSKAKKCQLPVSRVSRTTH